MPELPEVDTVARELREGSPARGASVVGRTISYVTVRWPRHIATPSPRELKRRLPGQTITAVSRRGKFVVFHLTQGYLLVHLRMSGDLTVVNGIASRDKHAHTIFHFTDGYSLRFSDTRKFGKVFLVDELEQVTGQLGPEPLENSFTAKKLGQLLAGKQRALKPLLLDQTFLAGIGNIYADESLHLAKLHPLRRSDSLTPTEVKSLWQSLRRALRTGLRLNGASIDWAYRGGGFQHHFRVYDRAGEPCYTCGTPIRRMVVGQRGTHLCPRCQKLK
jgi:formamidopyrimidine-DNA glycosylase